MCVCVCVQTSLCVSISSRTSTIGFQKFMTFRFRHITLAVQGGGREGGKEIGEKESLDAEKERKRKGEREKERGRLRYKVDGEGEEQAAVYECKIL